MNISNINISNIYNVQNKPLNKGFRQSAFVQKPDTFEYNHSNITFTGKSNRIKRYEKTTDSLVRAEENAQRSLNGQLAAEGWAGKVADRVSALWFSKNRASLVQEDIVAYKKQVVDLKTSIKENKFEEKFEEMFGVKYKVSNINKYEEISKQFNLAVTTSAMADIVESKLNEDIKIYKENNGKLKEQSIKVINTYVPTGSYPFLYKTSDPNQNLKNLEKDLVDIVGSKDILESTLKLSGMDTTKMSNQEKYSAYGLMAEFLVETTRGTAKNVSKGKTIEELKDEYDNAYIKAYGTKNNIQERVEKYNRSQVIGAAAVRGVTRAAIESLVMLSSPATGFAKIATRAATTVGAKVLVDGSDKMSYNVENSLDAKAFKKLIYSASVSGAERIATGTAGLLIPDINTGSAILDEILVQSKNVAVDTTFGMISERLKKDVWAKNQILPRILISFAFNNLKIDMQELKTLASLTKGGINQSMKYATRGVDQIKTIVEGTKHALENSELKQYKSFEGLRDLAKNNPEEYTKMMISTLEEVIKEHRHDEMD